MQEQVSPSSPGTERLPLDAGTLRMLVQIMKHMGDRQDAMERQIEELTARLTNLNGAFTSLLNQLEKKIDMIEAAAIEKARSKSD